MLSFRVLASDLESEVNQFCGFLQRFAFPVFSTRFLTDFFTYYTQISTENIYRILIKQTGQEGRGGEVLCEREAPWTPE
jgi:hypothetical protein